jgi:hypothetical protein
MTAAGARPGFAPSRSTPIEIKHLDRQGLATGTSNREDPNEVLEPREIVWVARVQVELIRVRGGRDQEASEPLPWLSPVVHDGRDDEAVAAYGGGVERYRL